MKGTVQIKLDWLIGTKTHLFPSREEEESAGGEDIQVVVSRPFYIWNLASHSTSLFVNFAIMLSSDRKGNVLWHRQKQRAAKPGATRRNARGGRKLLVPDKKPHKKHNARRYMKYQLRHPHRGSHHCLWIQRALLMESLHVDFWLRGRGVMNTLQETETLWPKMKHQRERDTLPEETKGLFFNKKHGRESCATTVTLQFVSHMRYRGVQGNTHRRAERHPQLQQSLKRMFWTQMINRRRDRQRLNLKAKISL